MAGNGGVRFPTFLITQLITQDPAYRHNGSLSDRGSDHLRPEVRSGVRSAAQRPFFSFLPGVPVAHMIKISGDKR